MGRIFLFGAGSHKFNKNQFWRTRKFLPHRSLPQTLMLLWSVFFSVVIGYYILERFNVFAAAPLPPSNLVVVNDDGMATVKWNPSPDSDTVGYKVTWGGAGTQDRTSFTPYPDIQIQPLQVNTQYHVRVQAINKNGDLSNAIGPIPVVSDATYVKNLKSQMTGMFDDFNTNVYNGLPNPLNWYTTVQNASPLSMAYVSGVQNDLETVLENNASLQNGQKSSMTMHALSPFDFTNRIGTVAFDFDFGETPLIQGSANTAPEWALTISPTRVDTITYNNLYNGSQAIFPLEAFQVYMKNDTISLRSIVNGVILNQWDSTYSRIHPIRDIGVRKHALLKISKESAQLYIDGMQVLSVSNLDLGFSKGWIYNQEILTNAPTSHIPFVFSSFDNFGFDSGSNNQAQIIHTYTAGGYGSSDKKNIDFFNNSATYTITIPDVTTGEQAERLLIDANIHGSVIPKVTVNGVAAVWPILSQFTDGEEYNTRVIDLPVGTLHTGENTIIISSDDKDTFSVGLQNVHAEIEFPAGTNLSYTAYPVPFSGNNIETRIPPIAPIPFFGQQVPQNEEVVRGTVPIEVVADGAFSLLPTGHTNPVTQVALDIDGAPQTIFTLNQPTIKTDQILSLDTTKIPNGRHTLSVTAYGTDKNASGTIASLTSLDPLLQNTSEDSSLLFQRIITITNGASQATITPTAVPTQTKEETPTPTVSAVPTESSLPSTSSATLGNSTIGNILDVNESNQLTGTQFSTGERGGITKSMSVYVDTVDPSPNNLYQLAIYSDNVGKPGNLLASTIVGKLTAHSWNTLPISTTLRGNTTYWLLYNTNAVSIAGNAMRYSTENGVHGISSPQIFGTFPQSIDSYSNGTWNFSLFITYTAHSLQ